MSRDWEATFSSWGAAPSATEQTKAENAERAVRKAIDACAGEVRERLATHGNDGIVREDLKPAVEHLARALAIQKSRSGGKNSVAPGHRGGRVLIVGGRTVVDIAIAANSPDPLGLWRKRLLQDHDMRLRARSPHGAKARADLRKSGAPPRRQRPRQAAHIVGHHRNRRCGPRVCGRSGGTYARDCGKEANIEAKTRHARSLHSVAVVTMTARNRPFRTLLSAMRDWLRRDVLWLGRAHRAPSKAGEIRWTTRKYAFASLRFAPRREGAKSLAVSRHDTDLPVLRHQLFHPR